MQGSTQALSDLSTSTFITSKDTPGPFLEEKRVHQLLGPPGFSLLGGVLWLLSEVLAVELSVFQVPSAGGGVFLAMSLAAGRCCWRRSAHRNILQLEQGGGSR